VKYKIFSKSRLERRKYGGDIEIKVAFLFDDPKLLDECPFVCKIAEDNRKKHRYVGIAYGRNKDREALKEWAHKFFEPKLFTYFGEFLEEI